MTIQQARKILGKSAKDLTDEQLKIEIEMSEFLSELVLKFYYQQEIKYNE